MRKILIALIILLPFLSFTHAGAFDGITCSAFHVGCSSNTTANVPISNQTVQGPTQNITVETNKSFGTISLLSSSEISDGTAQYNYHITLPKHLSNNSIFSFYLFGDYNNTPGFLYPATTSCVTTEQIDCNVSFIVTIGRFDRVEIIKNGEWTYALALPSNIVTANTRAIVSVVDKPKKGNTYALYAIVAIATILIVGNVGYDRYRVYKNPNIYNEVNA